jgi:fructose-bisphosphate aldolase, class I
LRVVIEVSAVIRIPASVPKEHEETYKENYERATKGTGRLVLFAGDQKIEHLNCDFKGEGIAEDDADPEHLFRIASQGKVGVFAAQHGLISHYAKDYPDIAYLVKMNSKTDLVGTAQHEPVSITLNDLDQVLLLKENGVNVVGIGYTIYLGSQEESMMLAEAGRLIADAHANGLLVVIWMYPRGKAVQDDKDPDLIAGAAGVAVSLGADFVKINQPEKEGHVKAAYLNDAVKAAGRCGVITSGGAATDPGAFLHLCWEQLNNAGTRGTATGRNVHQRPLAEAVRMCKALSAIVYGGWSTHDAWQVYTGEKNFD